MAAWINEFHYNDNGAADSGERIEVAGLAGTDLSTWTLVLYNGSNGASYNTIKLSGSIPDQQNGFGTVAINALASNGIQNGDPDGIALVNGSGQVVQFLSYGGDKGFTATNGPALGTVSTHLSVYETNSTPVGHSLQLSGSGNKYEDFTWVEAAVATPNGLNNNQTFTAPGPDITPPAVQNDQLQDQGIADDILMRFNEAVTVDATKVTLETGDGTTVDAVGQMDGNSTFRLNPDADLAHGVSYTVKFAADAVQDKAGNKMAADTVTVTTEAAPLELKINEVQGEGTASQHVGQTVTVEAIVVGDFQNTDADADRNLGGFYLQSKSGDEDDNLATSEGVFIYHGNNDLGDVKVGDLVKVTGVVNEYNGVTQITASTIQITEEQAVPDVGTLAVDLTLTANGPVTKVGEGKYVADLEAYEGMLVSFTQPMTIIEQFNLDRYGEVVLTAAEERPFQYTANNVPDADGYDAHLQTLASQQITYENGLTAQNADIGTLDGFGGYDTASAPRMGDKINDLTGVLSFSFDKWRVQSIEDGSNTVEKVNPREDSPADVGGTLKIAGLNVLNYFTTLDANGNQVNGLDPRGANSEAELDRQTEKLVNVLIEMDSDVIGLVELQNNFIEDDSGNALQYLVEALNTKLIAAGRPNDVYEWVRPGANTVGTDAIAPGMIYRPSKVKIAEGSNPAILNDTVLAGLDGGAEILGRSGLNGRLFDGENASRNSVAVTFEELASEEQFTVVGNHFKSKGSGPSSGENADKLDGAGAWNLQRTLAAEALTLWLESNPTGIDDADRILTGDFNAYAKESPITTLEEAGYANLEDQAGAYSYVYDGQLGSLDYVFASESLSDKITGVTQWHINSDEADAIDYNLDFGRDANIYDPDVLARVSDHDPVIIGLDLAKSDTPTPNPNPNPNPNPTPNPEPTPNPAPAPEVVSPGDSAPDLAIFAGARSDYTIELGADGLPVSITGPDGINTLDGIGRLGFADFTLAFDVGAKQGPGATFRLYEGVLDRAPDRAGISFWVDAMDDGATLEDVADAILASPEFQQGRGAGLSDDADFVTFMYREVLGRDPDAAGAAFWLEALGAGAKRGMALADFSESPEHVELLGQAVANGVELDPYVAA